jgi:hypothetical protein
VNDATKPGGRSDLSDHGLTKVDEAASVNGPRKAPPDIGLLGELKAAVTRIELRQTVHEQVARQIVDMLAIHNEKLDAILAAATQEPGPSPVLSVLAEILESLREQESLLAELPGTLAVTMRDELQRELDAEDPEMEPAGPDFFDNRTNEGH